MVSTVMQLYGGLGTYGVVLISCRVAFLSSRLESQLNNALQSRRIVGSQSPNRRRRPTTETSGGRSARPGSARFGYRVASYVSLGRLVAALFSPNSPTEATNVWWCRRHKYRVDQKKWHTFFVRLDFISLNFIKYWPIFKLISVSKSGLHL